MVSGSRHAVFQTTAAQGRALDPELRSTDLDEPARQQEEIGGEDDGPTQMSQDSA